MSGTWDGWYDRDGRPFDENGDPTVSNSWRWPNNKRVGNTVLDGDVTVSTVHLGLDHRYGGGSPLIFETMIFGGEHDQYQRRYSTEEEAMRGHLDVLFRLRSGLDPSGGDDA